MEKRALIFVVISLAIIMGSSMLQEYLYPPPPAEEQQMEQTATAPKAPAIADSNDSAAPAVATQTASPESQSAQDTQTGMREKLVTVETDLYKATFSTMGGTLRSWELKQHLAEDGTPLALLDKQGRLAALAIGSGDDYSISDNMFELKGRDLKLTEPEQSGTLVFSFRNQQYNITRTLTFSSGSYGFELTDTVTGMPRYSITLGANFGINERESMYSHVGPVILVGHDREEVDADGLKEPEGFSGKIKWIAQEDKYFFSAILPELPMGSALAWKNKDSTAIQISAEPGTHKMLVYAGPKALEKLQSMANGLEHIVDFGFFSPIARPIFWLLQKLYSMVGNYGWAIVLLTIIIRVPFLPLVQKSQKSMKKLQAVQPKVKELRERLKDNPDQMNKEMMAIYKKHKVNPLGGCLPLLLQIPVFFALYKVLLLSIELRGAPWALWITDLSMKDPFYILPVVMGVSMFVQQKMTPTAGDPKQQKIMMFLPVVFTFMFLNFASGLVLYWLVNNLLSIAQQVYVNKSKDDDIIED